jgi:hypothetical protein
VGIAALRHEYTPEFGVRIKGEELSVETTDSKPDLLPVTYNRKTPVLSVEAAGLRGFVNTPDE